MNFNPHLELKEDQHAFLSPSQPHWLNYDKDKLTTVYQNLKAKTMGTRLHAYACESIKLNQKLPRSSKTLNMYVNDAIGFRMTPEQKLKYSDWCFGTTDAIAVRSGYLRIHDLKTGIVPADMRQLCVYAALYCLEYGVDPRSLKTELRIYQNDDVIEAFPTADEILEYMHKIKDCSEILSILDGMGA